MAKLNVIPGPNTSLEEDNSTTDPKDHENTTQESTQEKQPEIPEERILVWRCSCGKEMDRFGKEYTAHIKEGREKGEEHEWKLVDANTGEIVAENMRQASTMGLKATRRESAPKLAGGSSSKKDTDEELEKYRPKSPLVTKFVAYTVELPTDLLVLYKLFVDRCIALDKEPPTISEWVTQTISQFYLEHAEDFDIRGMAGDFIIKNAGGQNVR
ncbi:MAG: hypothetical protein WC359_15370 [Dehalococcoidia bacterium]